MTTPPRPTRRTRSAVLAFAASFAASLVVFASAAKAGALELPFQIGGAYNVPVESIKEARFAGTVSQRYDFSCGSAALSTLLTHHYGHPVSEDKVFVEMFARGDQPRIRVEGFSLLDMKHYLAAHGFSADGFQEPLDTLAVAGLPAIVLINEGGYNHFVVVKGLRAGRVLIGDPVGGTRALSEAAFRTIWVNRVLFVINNHRNTAAFNSAADWRAAPASPLATGVQREGLAGIVMPKAGPSDF
jgi:uncharacterized protein